MNNNLTKIDSEVYDTIRVSLLLNIKDSWKYRRSPLLRHDLKQNIKALRVMRETQSLYQEKFFWTK